MAKLFERLFGQANNKDEPYQPMPVTAPEHDSEYVAYCIELEQVVSALEENLHASDDPKEIAMQTLQVACTFYGGDWAGILEVDLEMDVWNPLWCFNMKKKNRTTQNLGEFELAKYMPNWVHSLKEGKPIIIPNVKEVQKEHPEEYAVYKRLEVDSVIGVPFGPNPVGFLAIRNPTRYVTRSSMMSILAKAVDIADEIEPGIRDEILAGKIKPTEKDVHALARADPEERPAIIEEMRKSPDEKRKVAPTAKLPDKPLTQVEQISEAMLTSRSKGTQADMLYELEDALDSLMFRWSMCLNNNRDYFADNDCHSQIQQLVQTGLDYLHQILKGDIPK